MQRRTFVLGTGALLLCGCASEPRAWQDVPWVGASPPPGPPPPPRSTGSPEALSPRPVAPSPALTSTPTPTPTPMPGPAPAPVRAPAAAAVARPALRLVSRAQWGAQPLRANHDPLGPITRLTLHHTDEHPGMCGRPDADVVRAIQAYHQDGRGWADIGYHYLVGHDGAVYEGRSLAAQGAHSGGENNRNNLGISVIGCFGRALPAPAQLAALRALLADRQAAHGLAPAALLGHRDLAATECPGSALYAWLEDVRRGRA